MKHYNFDEIIDRRGTGCVKVDQLENVFGQADLLPLWVADMDFRTPDFIVEAIRKRCEHEVFGYPYPTDEYYESIITWVNYKHNWKIQREWLCYVPGIVKGIAFALHCFTAEGDKVIIQPPVYHPFRVTPEGNGREVVYNPLREKADGSYEMNFDNLEAVADDRCRLLILSNPHNPAGIIWDKQTLARLADFCTQHHIIVVSDEIHGDMALWGKQHVPFALASEAAAQCSITFGAPSKTFNIAGIVSSYAIVPNDQLREKFYSWLTANELNEPDIFAPIATIAAFEQGEEWRQQMLHYIEENIIFVEDYCRRHLPAVRPLRPEASFLVWLDCRDLKLNHDQLVSLFVDKARLAFNDGEMFGQGGKGFMRMNVGAPRAIIHEALERLKKVL